MAHHTFRVHALILALVVGLAHGLHLQGTWNSGQFFNFLTKFGFQKTDMHDPKGSQGYIYGNVTSTSTDANFTLVVVDSEYFIEFFGNSTQISRTKACGQMFSRIDKIAWDERCHQDGTEDFLRRIPCPSNQLCADEDNPGMVIKGFQFTYRVQDTNQPRFWYVSLVACNRNKTCSWLHPSTTVDLQYDIWLVNGDPNQKTFNPFEHQFSFESHDIVEIFLTFMVLYTLLTPIELYSCSMRKHTLSFLLCSVILIELTGALCNCVHYMKFAYDGSGVTGLSVLGDSLSLIGSTFFMALLLLLAKGWGITTKQLSQRFKKFFVVFWFFYIFTQLSFFVWRQMESEIISAEDAWQTLPGALMLFLSTTIVFWFLFELKSTFNVEENYAKMSFYLHLGAGYLSWFIYKPILALVCSQVSALWRYKTWLGVSYAFDFLAISCMVHILWPGTPQFNVLFGTSVISSISAVRAEVSEGKRLLGDGEESSDQGEEEEREAERELSITLLNR